MRRLLLSAVLLSAACTGAPSEAPAPLAEGRWAGSLTPMNHPDQATPVAFDIREDRGAWTVTLLGPGGATLPGRDVSWDGATLRFTFDEPEAGVPLACAWTSREGAVLAGRCTDADGRWAQFDVRHAG